MNDINDASDSTPPADDVREALVKELRLWAKLIGTQPRGARDLFNRAADAIAEVRPRGTVTDAEVASVREAIGPKFHGLSYRERMIVRAALEAARNASGS